MRIKTPFWAYLLRRTLRRARQTLHCGSLQQSPTFFANSFPKSGTHLLTQVMHGFTEIGPAVDSGLPAIVTFRGDSGRKRQESEILGDLERLLPGDIAYGHLHALPAVETVLCQPGMATYFILRDPRDVVVSHVPYLTEMASHHVHHHYYQHKLSTFEERLTASIQGVSDAELGPHPLPNIRARFEPYLGWLGHPETLTIHYEDFITQRAQAIGNVFDHAVQRGFTPTQPRSQAIQVLSASIDPQRSPTFRSGKIGGWKTAFTPDHRQLFKEITGDLLVQLGYETSLDW